MYNGSMEKLNIDPELLQAADKFLMVDLVAICVEHLKSNLTLENALDVLIVAYQTNQDLLCNATFQFAQGNKGKLKIENWNEIAKNLTSDNALDILLVAYQNNQELLCNTAFKFTQENKGKLKMEKWKEMTKNHPDLIANCLNKVVGFS